MLKKWKHEKSKKKKSIFPLAHSESDAQRPNIKMNWVYQTNATANDGVPMETATTMSIDMKTISLCFPYFREDISIFRYFYFYKKKSEREKIQIEINWCRLGVHLFLQCVAVI